MNDLVCPTDYSCVFTRIHPREIYHTVGPWYQHTAGWIVAIVAILALAVVLAYVADLIHDLREGREKNRERELERQHQLAIEEQRTMQADAAKGNPEMLKLIRQKI